MKRQHKHKLGTCSSFFQENITELSDAHELVTVFKNRMASVVH